MDSYGELAWKALRLAERTQARLRWQPELKCDSIVESADELSGENALKFAAGSADFLHISAARRLNRVLPIDQFWTCDQDQSKAAKAVALRVRLFTV